MPFDPTSPLLRAVNNVLCSLLFGERCSKDPEFEHKVLNIEALLRKRTLAIAYVPLRLIKFLNWLPAGLDPFGLKPFHSELTECCEYLRKRISKHVERVRVQYDAHSVERDCFVDAFIAESLERTSDSAEMEPFSELRLLHSITGLLHAGADPLVSTLRWALYLMARHPDVQRRAQRELDAALSARAPRAADRRALPFTDALLCEVQRLASVCPVARLCVEEELDVHVEVQDEQKQRADDRERESVRRIPAGTFLLANLYGVHRDPAIWAQPNEFHVENFYDEASNTVVNQSFLIPFSSGKWKCVGESLTQNLLFIFFVRLLQEFEITPARDEPLPAETCLLLPNSLLRNPVPFKVTLIKRAVNLIRIDI